MCQYHHILLSESHHSVKGAGSEQQQAREQTGQGEAEDDWNNSDSRR